MRKRRKKLSNDLPTLEHVAREAGVSIATVSRALNFPEVVREETKARVAEAIARTGYTPNFAGRALALNRTSTVGAVIPTLNNAIFAQGVNAFETALRERNYTLLLSVSNYDAVNELTNVRRMIERGVDAVMLVGTDHENETIAAIRKAEKPFVCAWSYAPSRGLPNIGFDNSLAMHDVIDHLVALGHRDIAMIAGITVGNDRARDRVAGVREALAQRGLTLLPGRLVEARYSVGEAFHSAVAMVSGPPARRPTAIVCGNDVIAYGALSAAARCGVAVPQELSVVGFDDLSASEHISLGLTTVRVPATDMGMAAANRLADMVEGLVRVEAAESVALPTTLIVRGTTGPPPPRSQA